MRNVLIASFSEDFFVDKDLVLDGGPAKFIIDVFNKNEVSCDLITSANKAKVEIININGEDKGKIKKFSKIPLSNLDTNCNLIISTLANEVDLEVISKVKGISALDIQGFVRDTSDYGKKKHFEIKSNVFDIIKGTKEEISYINKDKIKEIPILLVTNGSKEGYILSYGRIVEKIKPLDKKTFKNTVGAGDTFLANFFVKYINTKDIKQSLNYATQEVNLFLEDKNA
jgi:hypothetical protein